MFLPEARLCWTLQEEFNARFGKSFAFDRTRGLALL